ncbi:hypothetical protein [Yersinia pseudotuberculosis]|uniref:hypothetical protein n=1 Tax=Yersinia pseudotuberculosis TaxID=633 RepID=UPI002B31191C|nr:hypothetical protein YPSE1_27520 [Yersinia pseudotuberculosis]BET63377.1 hypothetical protein YPSE1_28360 [Yersinia pseudotuberculosis]BET64838.1 hypothetical protein YPSE1_42970 [Yersinia pseudotuberculosis]
MQVEISQSFKMRITELERLDPVEVLVDDYEPGRGKITITCYGKAWTASWFAMSGQTISQFFRRCDNDYLIGYLSPQLDKSVDDDNDANIVFVKQEIIKLRRDGEITSEKARIYWGIAESSDDVKYEICNWISGSELSGLLGDDPYYANWPTVENHHYKYLSRICDAVKEAFGKTEGITADE